MEKKYVYLFDEGKADMKGLLGGKGAGLAEMTNLGLPVPPGFTITTEACIEYSSAQVKNFPPGMEAQMSEALHKLEQRAGKTFGDPKNLLLVSVRSGAKISMPGMMDTVLNLGLNDETARSLAAAIGDMRFALDCYRRFIQMFSDIVLGIEIDRFEEVLARFKARYGLRYDYLLTPDLLQEIIKEYKMIVKEETGADFPQNPSDQLRLAVKAVFDSWNNPRAIVYRKINQIPDDLGTAVNVQAMVFGNMGENCGTGVAFTRNPSTGEKALYGEYLMNAQGEDVVAGIRTPYRSPSSRRRCRRPTRSLSGLPPCWRSTTGTCKTWSSPSNAVNYTCCRPGPASGQRPPP